MNSEIIFPTAMVDLDGEKQQANLITYDLIKNRTIHVTGEINELSAMNIISQITFLQSMSNDRITLKINSPGGEVASGIEILAYMQSSDCEIRTIVEGEACSMAAVLAAAGTKGQRYIASKYSSVMIHQPLGGAQGQATDIILAANHISDVKEDICEILSNACNQSREIIMKEIERDHWLKGYDAIDFGISDHVGMPKGE